MDAQGRHVLTVRLSVQLGLAVWQNKCNTVSQGVRSGDTARFLYRHEGNVDMGYRQLTQDERYVIARMLNSGHSTRDVARMVDRAVSTISRGRSHERVEKALGVPFHFATF
jgi:hypothetical protein